MFIKNFHLTFLRFLIIGTLIAISANSWFTSWLGLEINLISIIPLILNKTSSRLSEASIKYFLAQAIASIILIFIFSLNFFRKERIELEIIEIFIMFSLALKAGLAPFHYWFPQVINSLIWPQCTILFTWQKIAPLILICSISTILAITLRIISTVVGALGGFNQIFIKIILTYSSISHRGWIIIACLFNFNSWAQYFFIYCLISISIIIFFYLNQAEKTSEIVTSQDSEINKNILFINILSLGGLPPLLGFSAKINIIIITLKFFSFIILIPLIVSSLISLFFYLRVVYSAMFFKNKKNIIINQKNKTNSLLFTFRALGNILAPVIFLT